MSKSTTTAGITYVAYVLLLVAFVGLGVFVAALALDSGVAGAAAVALVASLTASIVGFRTAAARRKRAAQAAGSTYKLSIWTETLHPHELDVYRANYRGRVERAPRTLQEAA